MSSPGPPPSSPRSNLRRLLQTVLGSEAAPEGQALQTQMDVLMKADAENKASVQRRLYLVLDLDETLVFSSRMKPGAEPAGHQITVRDSPFDMVLRPGLLHFLQVIRQTYVVSMYTMGDEEYTRAVLDVIDPQRQLFAGGVCSWRPSESREFKYLSRVACDSSMAVIVDDSIDVWRESLPNLCLTRRFVGDPMDDGLMLLSQQLQQLHHGFFAARDAGAAAPPPSLPEVLSELRSSLLEGCIIAFTGLVADQSEETLASQPLCTLVRLYGAQVTLEVDDATHLVARKKEGWKSSSKIRRAMQRQESDQTFRAVWDHWLLDSMVSFKRQAESNYAVRLDEEEVEYIVPGRLDPVNNNAPPPVHLDASLSDILGAVGRTNQTQMRVQPATGDVYRHAAVDSPGVSPSGSQAASLPLRKRPRDDEPPQVPKVASQASNSSSKMSVADYLKQKTTAR
tara:strand:- start:1138 stop:2496 length:1359 start_codon:yes stop_codon:yes gene_type:complete